MIILPEILQEAFPENSRMRLKAYIISTRGKYLNPGGPTLDCPICGKTMTMNTPMDLHEALISRSQVQNHHLKYLIFHPCNVVLRHNSISTTGCKHEGGVGGDEIFAKCAKQIAYYETSERVTGYLMAMQEYFPIVARDALRRFISLGE